MAQFNKSDFTQIFDDHGNHTLTNTKTGKAFRASYTGWIYLDGWVSCTDYYTGTGEQILTPDEFCKLGGSNYPVN